MERKTPKVNYDVTLDEAPSMETPYSSLEMALSSVMDRGAAGARVNDRDDGESFTLVMDHAGATARVVHLHHPELRGVGTWNKWWPWSAFSYRDHMEPIKTCWHTTHPKLRGKSMWRLFENKVREPLQLFFDTLRRRHALAVSQLDAIAVTLADLSGYDVSVEYPEDPDTLTTWADVALIREALAATSPEEIHLAFDRAWGDREVY